MRAGVQGGVQTNSTFTPCTPGRRMTEEGKRMMRMFGFNV